MAGLTDKQQRFVDEYLVDLNATQAAIRAGYSAKTAGQIGDQNLKKLEIQAAIQRRKKELSEKTKITQQMVLEELGKVAFESAEDSSESKLKYANKLRALELLGKHLGLFDKDAADADGEIGGIAELPAVMQPTQPPEEVGG